MTSAEASDVGPAGQVPAAPSAPEETAQQAHGEPAPGEGACASSEAEVQATVEAILFASEKPLLPARISEIGLLGGTRNVRRAVEALNQRYQQMGSAFRIVHIAGGFQMQTLPEYADVLTRLVKTRDDTRLTQAALETLAVIAYRQPVLRADVEAIRGVACGEVIRGLMEKNLVRIVGRAEEIGRPLLYGTSRQFLEVFGLASLDDLPNVEQLRVKAQPAQASPPAAGGQGETTDSQPEAAPAEDRQPEPSPPADDDPPTGESV